MPKNALILKKPSGTISIQLNVNEQQQKMYNVLLKKAEEALKRDRNCIFYETRLSEILNKGGISETNYKKIKASLLELYDITVEYNILGKDDDIEIEERAHLLDNLRFTKKGNQITIRYSIPDMVRRSIVRVNDGKGVYAIIDLTVIKHLRSKYTIKLYELVKDYKNTEIPKMSLKTFRKLFGIEDKYTTMTNLRARVLNPAIKELNENENIDFLVSYELLKEGRKYAYVKFHVRPKPQKMKLEQQKHELFWEEVKENPNLQELLLLLPTELRTTKVSALLLRALEKKSKEYIQAQIQYCLSVKEKKGITNFAGYLKKAIENDYAGHEVVPLEELVKEEKKPDDYIGRWLILKEIGYIIRDIRKTEKGYDIFLEDKTGVKKVVFVDKLQLLDSYLVG